MKLAGPSRPHWKRRTRASSNIRGSSWLVDSILPSLAGLTAGLPPAARLAQAVESNVRSTVHTILESPEGQVRLVAEGRTKIIGALYEIEAGRVRFLADKEEGGDE